jgi:hypothetical protein
MLFQCCYNSLFLVLVVLSCIWVTYKTWLNLFPFSVTFMPLFPMLNSSHTQPCRSSLFAMWETWIHLQMRLFILNGVCDLPRKCYDSNIKYGKYSFTGWLGNKPDLHVNIIYTPHVNTMLPYCNVPSRIPDKHK